MWNLEFGFDRPEFLWLLLMLPVFWAFSFRTLASLGNVRRLTAIALRTAVALLFILALAEMQFQRISDKVTVIFLLDQSDWAGYEECMEDAVGVTAPISVGKYFRRL